MADPTCASPSIHALLLLSDSALPLGSFAFSSGLESFLAHHKQKGAAASTQAFYTFLDQSLLNVASTNLPYVLAGFREPASLPTLDDHLDASTPCTVARRASVTQGRALMTVWERALSSSLEEASVAADHVSLFARSIKTAPRADDSDLFRVQPNGHLAPLFGAVCCALGLHMDNTAYIFLLNHAKAVLSAAVRASVIGPYQSQTILAGRGLQAHIAKCITQFKDTPIEDAAVTVPPMDLWMGRHELLYSRIFNS